MDAVAPRRVSTYPAGYRYRSHAESSLCSRHVQHAVYCTQTNPRVCASNFGHVFVHTEPPRELASLCSYLGYLSFDCCPRVHRCPIAAEIGNYHYGQGHPMKPHRVRMTHNLVVNYGLYRQMEVFRPKPISSQQMTRFHSDDYINFLRVITQDNMQASVDRKCMRRRWVMRGRIFLHVYSFHLLKGFDWTSSSVDVNHDCFQSLRLVKGKKLEICNTLPLALVFDLMRPRLLVNRSM